jgi:hypothetical protein
MSAESFRFRNPSETERGMLTVVGEGDSALPKGWLKGLLVADIDDGGMGSLRLLPAGANAVGRAFGRIAAEESGDDIDRVNIIAALVVDDHGDPFELHVWKVDNTPVISFQSFQPVKPD